MAENKKAGIAELTRYALKNMNYIKAIKARDRAKIPLILANMKVGELNIDDPTLTRRVQEYNQAAIEIYKGKWHSTQASKTRSKQDWRKAFKAFKEGTRIATELNKHLENGDTNPVEVTESRLEDKGTEITYADDVPLVPPVTPVILLQGTDHDMGYQYAQQLIQVYGPWILEQRAGRSFTEAQTLELRRWEEQHMEHTPWVTGFAHGWAEGATDAGVAMSYEDALYLWVGDKPPAWNFLSTDGLPEIPPMACSGVAAWGEATPDGKLVTGSTGDHDLSYQVIIVAFPSGGYPFIYSAFGATGAIAAGGDIWFFGHPAMNSRGLAYVHHGGGPKFLEPKEQWGYGVRRSASVMHIMRYAESARQAMDIEMSMPIGDVGMGDQATVGGFYADDSYGYVIESRSDPVAIREAGMLGETSFLYANNSVAHPDAMKSEWMSLNRDDWTLHPHGGWRPKQDVGMTKSIGLFLQWASGRLSTSDMMTRGMMFSYTNSCKRNQYMFNMMEGAKGAVDMDYMKLLYRNGGTIPEGDYGMLSREYSKTGRWGKISCAHSSNALTAVMKPGEGLFAVCTGPAKRGMAPMMPTSVTPIHDETNAFYEIKLGEEPVNVVDYARGRADEYIAEAEELLASDRFRHATERLQGYLAKAREEYVRGESQLKVLGEQPGIYDYGKALRSFTRAQVKARQVINACSPPPCSTGADVHTT